MSLADLVRLFGVGAIGVAAVYAALGRRIPRIVWVAYVGGAATALSVDLLMETTPLAPLVPPVPAPFGRLGFGTAVLGAAGVFGLIGGWWSRGDALLIGGLGLLYPTPPSYTLPQLPGVPMRIPQTFSAHGVFAFDILPNIVIVAFATYLSLAVINIASGHISRRIFTSVPIGAGRVADVRGRLLTNVDTGRPVHTTTIREYAEWNGESVTAIAETPVKTSPSGSGSGNGSGNGEESEFTYDRGNGDTDDQRPQEVRPDGRDMPPTPDTDYDRWNAVAFVTERDTDAAPDDVRVALNHIAANETVWVAPSLPFAFAILLGTVIALIAGTSLFLAPLG